MIKRLSLVTVILSLTSSVFAAKLNMDKGVLNIKFKNVDKVSASYTLPAECSNQNVELSTTNESITVKHTNNKCPSGATVNATFPNNKNTTIVLESGVIQLSEDQLIKNFSEINAKVNSGAINSRELISTRTSNYSGAILKHSSSTPGVFVKIKLSNGVINIK